MKTEMLPKTQIQFSFIDKLARFCRRVKGRNRQIGLHCSALVSNRLITQNVEKGANQIVVSLTTHSHRFRDVYLVVESIAHQTYRPARVILWLDEVEYKATDIPPLLRRQINRGLEVRFCANYRSYKKLIPTLKICPEATIVTIDDDVLYPKDMLQQLVKESQSFPGAVIAHRARKIKFFEEKLSPYCDWEFIATEDIPSSLTIPIGIGGVLYPPNSFHADIELDSVFLHLAPNADDIWFKAMSVLNNIECKKTSDSRTFNSRFLEIPGSQVGALHHSNLRRKENDIQIASVFDIYEIGKLLLQKMQSKPLKMEKNSSPG